MGQLYFGIATDHDSIDEGVIGGIGVDHKHITAAHHEVGMATADSGIVTDAVIHKVTILAERKTALESTTVSPVEERIK